jgi:hypothetical protein
MNEIIEADAQLIDASGLFDRPWCAMSYADAGEQPDLLRYFCQTGWRLGLQPNPYFDTVWYQRIYAAELQSDENPVLHYLRRGERENAWPSAHFDPEWYRDQYRIGKTESPLRHYLANRSTGLYSPLPIFDSAAYASANPGWASAARDPYLHWLEHPMQRTQPPHVAGSPLAAIVQAVGGNLEEGIIPDSVSWSEFTEALRLLIPFIPFDDEWYRRSYPDVAEAVDNHTMSSAHDHFLAYGFFEGRTPAPPADAR